jgi:hypothetical protein
MRRGREQSIGVAINCNIAIERIAIHHTAILLYAKYVSLYHCTAA